MPTPVFALDVTGLSAANLVVNEQHSVNESVYSNFCYVVPNAAPFFANGFIATLTVAGVTTPLVLGSDYDFALPFVAASDSTGLKVYGAITFNSKLTSGTVTLRYQVLGGNWTCDKNLVLATLANIAFNPRSTKWENVSNVQATFPVSSHETDWKSVSGQQAIMDALGVVAAGQASKAVSTYTLGGATGPAGSFILKDVIDPISTVGADGDTFINLTTGWVWSKAAGAWTATTGNLAGAAGLPGLGADTLNYGNKVSANYNIAATANRSVLDYNAVAALVATPTLASLPSSISGFNGNVVASCYYNTLKDYKHGEWRYRCNSKSWYNEANAPTGKWLGYYPTELQARHYKASVGNELMTNPGFSTGTDWTVQANWVLSGGVASFATALGASAYMSQVAGLVLGSAYRVTYDVIVTSGAFQVYAGNLGAGAQRTSSGHYEEVINANGNDRIYLFALAGFTGSVTNISIKRVTAVNTSTGDYYYHTTDKKFYRLGNGLVGSQRIGDPAGGWSISNNTPMLNYDYGLDGTLSATGIQDTVGVGTFKTTSQPKTIPINSTFTYSIHVKKETSEIGFGGIGINLTGGTAKNTWVVFNAVTGAYAVSSASTVTPTIIVYDAGRYWRIAATVTDTFANTSVSMSYYGTLANVFGTSIAYGIGSIRTIWGAQFDYGSVALPYDYTAYSTNQNIEVFRGSTKPFPQRVYITAEVNRVVIWDMKDGSMWMVFVQGTNYLLRSTGSLTSIVALNGTLLFGNNTAIGVCRFVDDTTYLHNQAGISNRSLGTLVDRNVGATLTAKTGSGLLVNSSVNSLAITVLPTAPIDPATGMPIPTIAVGTSGGTSVIKDDGAVVALPTNRTQGVYFIDDRLFIAGDTVDASPNYGNPKIFIYELPSLSAYISNWVNNSVPSVLGSGWNTRYKIAKDAIGYGSAAGTVLPFNTQVVRFKLGATYNTTMMAAITNTYPTGLMPGDIRLATLADTVVETCGVANSGVNIVTGDSANFNGGTVGNWNAPYQSSISVVASQLVVTATGTNPYATLQVPLTIGTNYIVSFDMVAKTAGVTTASVFLGTSPALANAGYGTSAGATAVGTRWTSNQFTATTNILFLQVLCSCGIGDTFTIDNISVVATNELVQNGTNPTTTNGWAGNSGATISVSGGAFTVTSPTGNVAETVLQTINGLVVGKSYAMSALVSSVGGNTAVLLGGGGFLTTTSATPTMLSFQFIAAATSVNVGFRIASTGASAVGTFSKVSCIECAPDRSVKGIPLTVVGNLTKSAVNTGSQLVAYSGFTPAATGDGVKYLDYSGAAFSTLFNGSFHMCFWWNPAVADSDFYINTAYPGSYPFTNIPAVNGHIFSIQGGAGTKGLVMQKVNAGVRSNSASITVGTISVGWQLITIYRYLDVLYFYKNGVLAGTSAVAVDSLSDQGLWITGVSGGMALFRISATAPTPDQIAYMYESERKLFEPNAKCCIQGVTSSVLAMDYSDLTGLLVVGTAGTVTEFDNLVAVNNYPVPASIGTLTDIESQDGYTILSGTTGTYVYRPSKQLDDDLIEMYDTIHTPPMIPYGVPFTATASQTDFILGLGQTPNNIVYVNNAKVATSAYTIKYDSFRYTVSFTVGLSLNASVTIMCTTI